MARSDNSMQEVVSVLARNRNSEYASRNSAFQTRRSVVWVKLNQQSHDSLSRCTARCSASSWMWPNLQRAIGASQLRLQWTCSCSCSCIQCTSMHGSKYGNNCTHVSDGQRNRESMLGAQSWPVPLKRRKAGRRAQNNATQGSAS
eukprot:1251462-Pleurochrysis_carterae.AAC.4